MLPSILGDFSITWLFQVAHTDLTYAHDGETRQVSLDVNVGNSRSSRSTLFSFSKSEIHFRFLFDVCQVEVLQNGKT